MSITKIIACADLHFRNLEGLNELQETLQVFIKDCKKIIEKEESPDNVRIVVAGDIFESKLNTSNESMIAVGWFFRELNKLCKTIVIVGNHDLAMYNLQRVDSLTPLFQVGAYENIKYLDAELDYQSGCYIDDNVVWCLYSTFNDFNRPEIDEMKLRHPDKKFVGLIHGDINGAMAFNGRITENGLDPNMFEGLDFVIAGHIHKRQEIKRNGVRIVYCSSIKQKDFGETVTQHGYVLWDITKETPEYQYVDVKSPKYGHYKLSINSIDDIDNNTEELLNF